MREKQSNSTSGTLTRSPRRQEGGTLERASKRHWRSLLARSESGVNNEDGSGSGEAVMASWVPSLSKVEMSAATYPPGRGNCEREGRRWEQTCTLSQLPRQIFDLLLPRPIGVAREWREGSVESGEMVLEQTARGVERNRRVGRGG
jgi:hypothetical protein